MGLNDEGQGGEGMNLWRIIAGIVCIAISPMLCDYYSGMLETPGLTERQAWSATGLLLIAKLLPVYGLVGILWGAFGRKDGAGSDNGGPPAGNTGSAPP